MWKFGSLKRLSPPCPRVKADITRRYGLNELQDLVLSYFPLLNLLRNLGLMNAIGGENERLVTMASMVCQTTTWIFRQTISWLKGCDKRCLGYLALLPLLPTLGLLTFCPQQFVYFVGIMYGYSSSYTIRIVTQLQSHVAPK